MLRNPLPLLALLLCNSSAFADEVAERRAICTPLVTAIYEGCEVENHYACPDGRINAESLSTARNMRISLFNTAYNMDYQYDPVSGAGAYHVIATYDPFDMELLLSEGVEEERLRRYSVNMFGVEDPYDVQATYAVTDQTRSFTVGEMQVLDYTQTQEVGFAGNIGVVEGVLYLDQSLGRYFNGAATVTLGNAEISLPNLLDIVGPASPFFMTQNPEDTCQGPLS